MQDSTTYTIRTLECDLCDKYDSITLSDEEIRKRTEHTDMGIGSYAIQHRNHTRIVYFDSEGTYLGDSISTSHDETTTNYDSNLIPFYIINRGNSSAFHKLRKKVISILHKKNLTISIAGPSRAGKTSLIRYLDTLIPERESNPITSVPTMGKSKKYIKIGNVNITSLDLGGQVDFWDLWQPAIDDSNAVIFLLDGTSSNYLEIAKAFERVINYRKMQMPVLMIINKKDLFLRGETEYFMTPDKFLSQSNVKLPLENVVALEASVFEGIAYEVMNYEENNLAEIISSFINEYC